MCVYCPAGGWTFRLNIGKQGLVRQLAQLKKTKEKWPSVKKSPLDLFFLFSDFPFFSLYRNSPHVLLLSHGVDVERNSRWTMIAPVDQAPGPK